MITLRPVQVADLPTLFALEQDLYPGEAWSAEIFESEIAGVPETRYYVIAQDAGVILGYAGLFSPLVGEVADIQTLSVLASEQGKGIGKLMLGELLNEALRRKAPDVLLEVREDNQSAIGLYISAGFAQISQRRNYYAPGIHAIIMSASADVIRSWLK